MTLLCVPIMVRDIEAALRDAGAARAEGADLVEYRLDEFFTGEGQHETMPEGTDSSEVRQILHLIAESPLPCIATCRPTGAEGGLYDGDEDARIALFERLGTAFGRSRDGQSERPPRYLDVEFSTYSRSRNIRQKVNLAVAHPEQVRDVETSLILSTHDFGGRPSDLTRRVLAMSQESAAKMLKVAFRARSIRDNLEIFDLLERRDRPMIALAMGEHGLISRVLTPKFGGFLTFASLRANDATAPGQPTVRELLDLYRFRSINAETKVFGVVGDPIGHSLSPHVHNAGFGTIGFDGVYLPLPVAGGGADAEAGYASLKGTLLEMLEHPRLNLCGLSVTIPHKEGLVRLAREQGWTLDEATREIGAANTLIAERGADGALRKVSITNTDAPAIVRTIASDGSKIRGSRIVVLGAGGVARAAAVVLAREGASVTIASRTKARGESLAAELARHGIIAAISSIDDLSLESFDLVINATPGGMGGGPAEGQTPLTDDQIARLNAGTIVFDTVYNPIETLLLTKARARGLRTLSGASMFVAQAEAQFSLFTGSPPPSGLFDRIVRERLGSQPG